MSGRGSLRGRRRIDGKALRIVDFDVPSIIDPRSEAITLLCDYELDGSELYSVQWYKDGNEFFKFTPSSNSPGYFYEGNNIFIDLKQSDNRKVTLINKNRRGGTNLAGTYACEVSAEGPNFLTTYAEANMSVAVPPKSAPAVDGLRPYYEVGDIMRAECTSAPSHPPAVLTFLLNEKEVSKSSTEYIQNEVHVVGNYATTTHQEFTLLLERHHFPGGSLTLTCEASFAGMPHLKTLRTKKVVTLISNNKDYVQADIHFDTVKSTASFIHYHMYVICFFIFLTNKIFQVI
ncbi:uncharacterized protein LOC127278107 isoform X2 [Leptopilina boulardi]|uniref:uncharacterized protein LOC127278107 isoform X2 n=1 Tax=Leptopilina boulardi TaxID=63433 RepID=UPI0021F579BA|nr:uncharacterized protein LOC127278107 isoform X2 [Leptopilina boulardi]